MREWALVALSGAIMILAGAIVAAGFFGAGFNVGSVGQWASAAGTTIAVWVAITNNNKTLIATEQREERKQHNADCAYVSALVSLANSVLEAIETMDEGLHGRTITQANARKYLAASNLEGLTAAIDRLPLHQAPDGFYIRRVDAVRTASSNVSQCLEIISQTKGGGAFDIKQELDLIQKAHARLTSHAVKLGHIPRA